MARPDTRINTSALIQRVATKLHMEPQDARRAAVVWAGVFADQAPEHLRSRLIGKPSMLSAETKTICELFFALYVAAVERAEALGYKDPVIDAGQIWAEVVRRVKP